MSTNSISSIYSELQHLYKLRKFEEVLYKTQSYNIEKLSATERCQLFIIKGKCFNQLERPKTIEKEGKTYLVGRKINGHRPAKEALIQFERALIYNPNSQKALNGKGKSLRFLNKKKEAYSAFAKAAKLGSKSARNSCIALFRYNPDFGFKKSRELKFSESKLYDNLSNKEPYLRYEALYTIRKQFCLTDKLLGKVNALSGFFFWCAYLPYTGDEDMRVRFLAREVRLLRCFFQTKDHLSRAKRHAKEA